MREGEEGIGNSEKSRAGKPHPPEAQQEQEGRKKEKNREMEKANIEGANIKSVSCFLKESKMVKSKSLKLKIKKKKRRRRTKSRG